MEASDGVTYLADWPHGMADEAEVAARVRVIYDSGSPLRFPSTSAFSIAGSLVRVACDSEAGEARIVVLR